MNFVVTNVGIVNFRDMLISNKIYTVDYSITNDVIFINNININFGYRNRGYCKRIICGILTKYGKPIHLLCFPTLYQFYRKLGFEYVCNHVDGYIEVCLKI